jgi:hypothetical protein
MTDKPTLPTCLYCEEPIEADEKVRRIAGPGPAPTWVHDECFVRSVVGGYNHQIGVCKCCGGSEPPDPPQLTKRNAAIVAHLYADRIVRAREEAEETMALLRHSQDTEGLEE